MAWKGLLLWELWQGVPSTSIACSYLIQKWIATAFVLNCSLVGEGHYPVCDPIWLVVCKRLRNFIPVWPNASRLFP